MIPEERRAKHAERFAERQARVALLKGLSPEVRKATIAEKKEQIRKLNEELEELKDSCSPHQFKPLSKEDLDDKWMSVGASCIICGGHFGWRCKVSPDGVCHYHTEDGKIELSDGTQCIWCGHSSERK